MAPNDSPNCSRTRTKNPSLGLGKVETGFKMNVVKGRSTSNVAVMRGCERHILRCCSRCNFHKQVQEQSACEMLSTFIRAAANKCKTKDVSHSLATAPTSKYNKDHTVSEMRRPHENAAAIAHQQPLKSFHSASATQGCKTLPRQLLETLTNSSTKL